MKDFQNTPYGRAAASVGGFFERAREKLHQRSDGEIIAGWIRGFFAALSPALFCAVLSVKAMPLLHIRSESRWSRRPVAKRCFLRLAESPPRCLPKISRSESAFFPASVSVLLFRAFLPPTVPCRAKSGCLSALKI